MVTDEELFDRWSAGDRAAGDAFIRRLFPPIHRFFASKVGSEAEELVQLTFSRLVEAKSRYQGSSGARAFVFGVARNVVREHYRRRTRNDVDVEEQSVRDLGAGPSTMRWRRREDEQLLEALRMLPLHMQTALELYYWEGLNVREIAEVLELPEGTVASRLRRGKQRLRAAYEGLPLPRPGSGDGDEPEDDAAIDAWAECVREAAPLEPGSVN